MSSLSFEIKARCSDPAPVRAILRSRRAVFKGLDHQVDTYFRAPSGRLKLREGNIENALIYYQRNDQKNSKRCDSILYQCFKGPILKKVLRAALGILVTVDKRREIYFIGNTKFHIDRVQKLGNFVEIEVFDPDKKLGTAKLRKQCEFYRKLLGIRAQDLVPDSYSDLILKAGRRSALR